jgi:hypothetical protein
MMPPELLHTSGSGLIMYMFELLHYQLGGGKDRDYINPEHIVVSNIIKCQSEHDFPRGSMHNGLIDGTKCQSLESKGNLFRLLCLAHKTKTRNVLQTALQSSDQQWSKFLLFIKMYLAMEEWFHDCNDKDEVNVLRGEISKALSALQKVFPRSDHTNGYSIPKMHGMTKMQSYIKLSGSGMNFYGGPGEAAHKTFVKSAGQKTQSRVSKFAQ